MCDSSCDLALRTQGLRGLKAFLESCGPLHLHIPYYEHWLNQILKEGGKNVFTIFVPRRTKAHYRGAFLVPSSAPSQPGILDCKCSINTLPKHVQRVILI